jgi:hypothetical protein
MKERRPWEVSRLWRDRDGRTWKDEQGIRMEGKVGRVEEGEG